MAAGLVCILDASQVDLTRHRECHCIAILRPWSVDERLSDPATTGPTIVNAGLPIPPRK